MQLLHDHQTALSRNPKDSDVEVKERSSHASLLLMNPVASGDNMATGLTSAHRLKEELPPLVPCCEGKELQINEDLVCSGLSAISVKHENVIHCLSSQACERVPVMPGIVKDPSHAWTCEGTSSKINDLVSSGLSAISVKHENVIHCLSSQACERVPVMPGLVKRRNSYRCLHRPDLKRVPYLRRMTPDELESLFRGHADFPSWSQWTDQQNTSRAMLPPDENIRNWDLRTKETALTDENGVLLHPIPEIISGADDVPVGMRLHGARARLYTSVQAGARAGDQLNCDSVNEVFEDHNNPDDTPEDEEQLKEELQIILPPRADDVTAESSVTSNITSSTNS